jgi:hypothetical protein
MESGIISKIEKARRYAEEPTRIVFSDFSVTVQGDHRTHNVAYHKAQWTCDCDYFATRGYCSHTMAMERVLGVMLPPEWREELVPA